VALSAQIQDDIKAALLGGDRFVGDTLRNLKAAILNEEVAQGKRDTGLSDEEIEKIIVREVKKRNESIELYEANDRAELAAVERQEAEVLSRYLPKQLTEDEIRVIAQTVIDQIGAIGVQQMGQVIGGVKAKAGASADGATVARIVKELLHS